LAESTGGTRFRSVKNPRGDLMIFRDFYTYHYCYADNNHYKVDLTNYGIILGECALVAALPVGIGCAVGCSLALVGFGLCVSICIPAALIIASGICSLIRIREWQISLQNDMAIARGYNDIDGYRGDKGFISAAFLTDNDNYMYRFYPRAENIEDDIKNKLESNLAESGSRFFHGGTRGGDIIKKCKLNDLFVDKNSCAGKNECSYKYKYQKFKADNTVEGDCSVSGSNALPGCLSDWQKKCIASYGVNFVSYSGIDINFNTDGGNFLSKYVDGDVAKDKWGLLSTASNEERDWVPVDIVYDTKYNGTEDKLADNANCLLGRYGDPKGDLSRCRGFEYDVQLAGETASEATKEFFTESQMVKIPLMTSPFLFYTLITPKNTPELFNPTFLAIKYYSYKNNNSAITIKNASDIILDFFNPKMRFDYDYPNGVSNPDYDNILKSENNFISQVDSDKNYSNAYILSYKSNIITTERNYKYVLHKTYLSDLHGEYIPKMCIYMISTIDDASELDTVLDLPSCSGLGCLSKESGEDFIVTDNDIACYPRAPLALNNLIMKPDPGMTYLKPIINVYLRPDKSDGSLYSYEEVSDEAIKNSYIMKQGDREDIDSFGSNKIQGYGLNFSRSYCSKAYYDYYLSIHEMEKQKSGDNDIGEIKRLQLTVNNIETIVIPDCAEEDGNRSEFITNITELKPYRDTYDASSVVAKKTAIVRQFNESYGAHNEVCVSDYDWKKILSLRSNFSMGNSKLPKVIAFKNTDSTRNRQTKCLLNSVSRTKPECLIADKVYVYCSAYEEQQEGVCIESVSITNFNVKKIKEINCLNYLGVNVGYENIEAIRACFKGGFNYSGNIHKTSGEQDIKCACEVLEPGNLYNSDLYVERDMTPREYGLCVDLIKPNICPAVKYYDSSGKYVDTALALNKTKEELMSSPSADYEQHIWRSDENILGRLPSVFFSETLGHAEFESSVYCEADREHEDSYFEENCIGGKQYVEGTCNGFWKNNSSGRKPLVICTAATSDSSEANGMIYEYKLLEPSKLSCERYECPAIGYDDNNKPFVDEKDIINKSGNMFDQEETEMYATIEETNYRDYEHNEEKDVTTVDMRGASNGFAIWRKTISNDFAVSVTSEKCTTGFAPAGAGSQVREYAFHEPDKIGRCRYDKMLSENREIMDAESKQPVSFALSCYSAKENEETRDAIFAKVVELYKQQGQAMETIFNSFVGLPNRLCNQLGEWLKVNDYYNYEDGVDDKKGKPESFYYNDTNNFWYKILVNPGFGRMGDADAEKYGSKYCERLVCNQLNAENYSNAYAGEVLECEKENTECKTWKHIGGADWEGTTAPRNSSNKITRDTVDKSSFSRNIAQIFNTKEDGSLNVFKYLKKVHGECKNLYGYYDRGTDFISDYEEQFAKFAMEKASTIDPRKVNITNADTIPYTIKPMRSCSSTGLWSGISDRCFRSCEHMDIFYTKFDPILYGNGVNIEESENYFVENYQIEEGTYSKLINDLPEEDNELKYTIFQLRNTDKPIGDFMAGDYLNGGAKWPRSIVKINSPFETTGSKKGLRYVDVIAECDSRYSRSDAMVTHYVLQSTSRPPKRRCYEDGSWGPVFKDTRCLLARNCTQFSFTVKNLASLITMYSNNQPLEEINEFIAGILHGIHYPYATSNCNPNDNISESEKSKCIIGTLTASATSIEDVINSTAGESTAGSYSKNDFKLGEGYNTPNRDEYPAICCLSENCSGKNRSGQTNNYNTGWNIQERDISNYFVPKVCRIKNTANSDFSANNFNLGSTSDNVEKYLNRLIFISDSSDSTAPHYVKSSLLHFVYDEVWPERGKIYFDSSYLENQSAKEVVIGPATYKSYQIQTKCNTDLFFNETDETKTYYYDKHIVFECLGDRFQYSPETKDNVRDRNVMFIRANDCKPRSCGGKYNIYQKLFSASYVKEVISESGKQFYNIGSGDYIKINKTTNEIIYGTATNTDFETMSNGPVSFLTCRNIKFKKTDGTVETFEVQNDKAAKYVSDSEKDNYVDTTFVVAAGQPLTGGSGTGNETDYNVYRYYIDRNNVSYQSYGFVETLQTTCSKTRRENNSINGSRAINEYDLHLFADLEYDKLPKRFCKELNRTNCNTEDISEPEIINGDDFKQKYCVPLGCPGKDLRFENGQVMSRQYSGARIFSLENYLYAIGDIVVIESFKGDYIDRLDRRTNITAPIEEPNYIYYQDDIIPDRTDSDDGGSNDKEKPFESGLICDPKHDIYNTGSPAPYSFYDYEQTLSDELIGTGDDAESERSKVSNCFSLLETNESIKSASDGVCDSGYEAAGSVCVKYIAGYEGAGSAGENIKSAVNSYSPDSTVIEGINTDAAEYVYKLLTDSNSTANLLDTEIEQYMETNIFAPARDAAKKEAESGLVDGAFAFYNPEYNNSGFDGSKLILEPLEEERYSNISSKIYRYEKDNQFYVKIDDCSSVETTEAVETADTTDTTETADTTETTVTTIVHSCEKMQKLAVFDEKYNATYESKTADLMGDFKTNIKDKKTNIAKLNELFDTYYKVFKMKNFLSIGTNVDIYNKYLSEIASKYMAGNDASYYVVLDGSDISFNSLKETDASDENNIKYYTYYIDTNNLNSDNFACKTQTASSGSTDDVTPTVATELSCSGMSSTSINEDRKTMAEIYRVFFVNFLSSGENFTGDTYTASGFSARGLINKYIDSQAESISYCNSAYETYMSTKLQTDAEASSSSSKFKSGLFMAMRCDVDGWKVIDSPSCKQRCNGSATFNLDPDGTGNFDVTEKVTDLRYSKSTGYIEVGAHRGAAACSCNIKNLIIYRYNGASFKCKDDGKMKITKRASGENGVDGYDRVEYHSHGSVWKIYCSGVFKAFGMTTESTTDIGEKWGEHVGDTQTDLSVETNKKSFTWRDFRGHDIAFLCPGDPEINTFYKMNWKTTKSKLCTNKFDGVTSIEYSITVGEK
jgi:hypothetical protein